MIKKKVNQLIGILLLLTLLGMIIYLFRAEWMAYVVDPVTRFFWAIWEILSRVDQNILWNFAIFLTAMLAFLLFPSTRYESQNNSYNYEYNTETQVAHWVNLLKKRSLEADGEQALIQAARRLAQDTLGLEPQQLTDSPSKSVVDRMPGNVARYLGFESQPRVSLWKRGFQKTLFLAPTFLRKRMGTKSVPAEFLDSIEWLEQELGFEEDGDEK